MSVSREVSRHIFTIVICGCFTWLLIEGAVTGVVYWPSRSGSDHHAFADEPAIYLGVMALLLFLTHYVFRSAFTLAKLWFDTKSRPPKP